MCRPSFSIPVKILKVPPHSEITPILSSFQSLCFACCLRRCWHGGLVFAPAHHPAPARRRRAAACSATAPAWLSCPKSFRVRPPPSTWTKTGSSSCQKGPLVLCPPSSLSLWTTTTSPSLPQEPLRFAECSAEGFCNQKYKHVTNRYIYIYKNCLNDHVRKPMNMQKYKKNLQFQALLYLY